MDNPFTISFGQRPGQYIQRLEQKDTVIHTFLSVPSPTNIYMITGIRGSGKTTFMSDVSDFFLQHNDWIVIDLNPNRNMLESLAIQLYNQNRLHKLLKSVDLKFSLPGIDMFVHDAVPKMGWELLIEQVLEKLKTENKRLLITIDEAVNNPDVKAFSSEFQGYLRKNYPVYLLMTGLYENIYDLQNEKSLTFLYRAPRIAMEPLGKIAVKNAYKKVFQDDSNIASRLSALTMGYPYAFQILGYLYWDYKDSLSFDEILDLFDEYLFEYAYEKIWTELSEKDKFIATIMAKKQLTVVGDICREAHMSNNSFSVYRKRLLNKGIVVSPARGQLLFALPQFEKFVIEMTELQ